MHSRSSGTKKKGKHFQLPSQTEVNGYNGIYKMMQSFNQDIASYKSSL